MWGDRRRGGLLGRGLLVRSPRGGWRPGGRLWARRLSRRGRRGCFLSLLASLLLGLSLTGCAVRPVPVMPDQALQAALSHPEVAAWHLSHSAPQVLEGLNPAAARGLQGIKPVAMVDLDKDGLVVRFDSALGPRPRRVEVLVDRVTGSVVKVRMPRGF